MGSMPGIIGAIQASLALATNPQAGLGTVHLFDGLSLDARTVQLRRRSDCQAHA